MFDPGTQWIIHYDLDPSRNFENLLAYAKVKSKKVKSTNSFWHVRVGKVYQPFVDMIITREGHQGIVSNINHIKQPEVLGVPKKLFPLYLAFMLDAIAVGISMPLLPFYIMELGANAFQLSLVISSNYVAQMIGCLVMGRVGDKYGRRVNLMLCLSGSCLSYFCVSRVNSLSGVALARIISGSFGGLLPVMQACVADVSDAG